MQLNDVLAAVRAEVSGERAHESVRTLATFHRVQASPGYDDAARWVATKLVEVGLQPEWEQAPGDGRTRSLGILMPRGWECTSAHADLVEGANRTRLCDYDDDRLSLALRSAPARGRFPIVAVEDGTDPAHYEGVDVRGKVILTSGALHRVHDLAVVERGAAGLLCDVRRLFPPVRTADDAPDALNYTSFWWGERTPRGWGFVVSPAEGARLRARIASGAALELDVHIESREFDTEIPLLSASIPGQGPGEVLLVAHLCHPQPSANDNASGASALLETAGVLSRLHATGAVQLKRGIRFLWVPELTGTAAWLAASRDRARGLVAALNLDMVGEDQQQCGSTLLIERAPCFAGHFADAWLSYVRRQSQDWITSYSGDGHFSLVRMAEVPYGGGSDHAVFLDGTVGVPCPMLIQWPDRYYHSSYDTPDRCDPNSLALAVRCAAVYAATLGGADDAIARAILACVALDARRGVLRALEEPDAARCAEAARLRGRRAISSVARIHDDPARIAATRELFDVFCEREAPAPCAHETDGLRADASPGARCPRRLCAGPLDFHDHLLPGFESLDAGDRVAFRRTVAGLPGGRETFDLAWSACDGQRSLDEIARLLWLETGHVVPVAATSSGSSLEAVFEWTARLSLTTWHAGVAGAWSLPGRDKAPS